MSLSKDALLEGMQFIQEMLRPKGFRFHFRAEGKGSGGHFAWGEFVRDDRRLELHFRLSLGLVRYHGGDQSVSHEANMREPGVTGRCQYPTFSDDPVGAFRGLAHDLTLAEDFVTGSTPILRKAAAKEEVDAASRVEAAMAGYVRDSRRLEELHRLFREGRYNEVLKVAQFATVS